MPCGSGASRWQCPARNSPWLDQRTRKREGCKRRAARSPGQFTEMQTPPGNQPASTNEPNEGRKRGREEEGLN